MMTIMGRERILNKIKEQLGSDEAGRRGDIVAKIRIQAHSNNLVPVRGRANEASLDDLFTSEAARVTTTVAHVDNMDAIPPAVADYLSARNLPSTVRLAPHPDLLERDWQTETLLSVSSGIADGDDEVSVTRALAGVAETGTLVMVSGAETPTTLNFLPLNNIVVVRRSEIKGTYEEVWAEIRSRTESGMGTPALPRTVNWITGPSRSADIEQTLLLGAHGPQRLHILIVDD